LLNCLRRFVAGLSNVAKGPGVTSSSVIPDQFETWISPPRFAPFLRQAEGDRETAFRLHQWHLQLIKECFGAIHHFEILLRNAVDNAFEGNAGRWLLAADLLPAKGRRQVADVAARCVADDLQPSPDRLVSRLPFSFWVHVFGRSDACEQLWRNHLHRSFPGAARRKDVLVKLEGLRKFRNRLAPHDSLLAIDVAARYSDLLEVSGWIDPDAASWIRGESPVLRVLGERPSSPCS